MFDWLKRSLELDRKDDASISRAAVPVPDRSEDVEGTRTVEAVIPLVREDVVMEKRLVEGDRVRIGIETLTQTESVEEDLLVDAVDIERVSVNRPLTEIPEIRRDGDVTIIPVVRERLVLKKELVLVEEIHVTHKRESQTVRREVDVRRQEPRIERLRSDRTVAVQDT